MRHQHIINAVFGQPWLITPSAHGAIAELIRSRILDPPALREGTGVCGEQVELDQMEIIDGTAIIPIGGVIARKLTSFEKGSGAVDSLDIIDELNQADSDGEVQNIILDIDSPGGTVNGTPELAEVISNLSKPAYAFTAGQMSSAAYWIGSCCEAVFAAPSAFVGSIGVYSPIIDVSKNLEMQGVSVELIKSGKYKGAGYPGTSLTDAQREQLQARVGSIADQFISHVRSMRGEIADSYLQGQEFSSREALDIGLIDDIFSNVDAVRDFISSK